MFGDDPDSGWSRAAAIIGPDGRVRAASDELCSFAGRPREELVGLPLPSLFGGELALEPGTHVTQLLRGHGIGPRACVLELVAVGDELVAIVRDPTEADAVQRSLIAIADATSSFAHEIKNPVTAVHLALRAAASALGEDEQAVLAELVARLTALERRLRRSLALVGPLGLDLQPCDARSLLEHCAAAAVAGAGVDLTIHTDGVDELVVDRERMTGALCELVRNAHEAGATRIRLSAVRAADGRIDIHVDDNGPGLDVATRSDAFRPLVAPRTDADGLGLALCRRVVEAHEGKVELSDSDLGGARLRVRLRASTAASL